MELLKEGWVWFWMVVFGSLLLVVVIEGKGSGDMVYGFGEESEKKCGVVFEVEVE